MKIKEFLKPDWKKILITLVIVLLSFFYAYKPLTVDAYEEYHGLPIFYWKYFKGSGPIMTGMNPPEAVTEFLYVNLFIDMVFWYLISCILIQIYKMVKKK